MRSVTLGVRQLVELDKEKGSKNFKRHNLAQRIAAVASKTMVLSKIDFDGLCKIVSHCRGGAGTQTPRRAKQRQSLLLFHMIDVDHSNEIDRDELTTCLVLMSGKVNGAPIGRYVQVADDIIDVVDTDGDGTISLDEFMAGQENIYNEVMWLDTYVCLPESGWDEWRAELKARRYREADNAAEEAAFQSSALTLKLQSTGRLDSRATVEERQAALDAALAAARPIRQGASVIVPTEFMSDGKGSVRLEKGMEGKVQRIDAEGDALILFDGMDKGHWVYKSNFDKLVVTESKQKAKPAWQAEGEGKEGTASPTLPDHAAVEIHPVDQDPFN